MSHEAGGAVTSGSVSLLPLEHICSLPYLSAVDFFLSSLQPIDYSIHLRLVTKQATLPIDTTTSRHRTEGES
jgi:hypothetical protein